MMVSAYASRLRLTLASVTADAGTELEAALDVLGLIASKGKVVTADDEPCRAVAIVARTVAHRARTDGATMGNRDVGNSERQWRMRCNRRTVAAINAQGGDWCPALKANRDSRPVRRPGLLRQGEKGSSQWSASKRPVMGGRKPAPARSFPPSGWPGTMNFQG